MTPSVLESSPALADKGSSVAEVSVGARIGGLLPAKIRSHLSPYDVELSGAHFLLHCHAAQGDSAAIAAATGELWEPVRCPPGKYLFPS